MKKSLSFLLSLVLLIVSLVLPAAGRAETMAEGMTPADTLALALQCAMTDGYEMDKSSVKQNGDAISAKAGIFTFTVEIRNGFAYSVSVACNYLDADYATAIGKIFGRMLKLLGGFTEIDSILTSIDFNVFNTLSPNTQTLIQGDYKVIVKVDPSSDNAYSLTLRLVNPVPEKSGASTVLSAGEILSAMNPDLSAFIVYTEETDPNQTLGKEGSYQSKVNFALRSVDPSADSNAGIEMEQGGSIEVFALPSEAVSRSQKVMSNKLTYFSSYEYNFVCGNALLRLSPDVSPEEAGLLVTAFMRAVLSPAAAPASQISAGDFVRFGSYEQDGDLSNGKEPIRWLVLAVDGGAAMLVSENALDVWNIDWKSPTWDNSTLRAWLNKDFLNEAFSADEQASMAARIVPADKNPNYPSDPGADTEDFVFCLSYPEADSLMTYEQRKTEPTVYARTQKNVYTDGGYCYWWLRSPGKPGCGAAIVGVDGSYDYDVSYDGFCYGIRPSIWVNTAVLTPD